MSYYKNIMKKGGILLTNGRICNFCKSEKQRSELDINYLTQTSHINFSYAP